MIITRRCGHGQPIAARTLLAFKRAVGGVDARVSGASEVDLDAVGPSLPIQSDRTGQRVSTVFGGGESRAAVDDQAVLALAATDNGPADQLRQIALRCLDLDQVVPCTGADCGLAQVGVLDGEIIVSSAQTYRQLGEIVVVDAHR